MSEIPMLADFAIRLAFGLAFSLLWISWREVPLGFFRTQSLIMLGLLVLGGLDQGRAGGPAWALWILVAGAVMAYFAAITWGLGLPRFGAGATVAVMLATAAWLGAALGSSTAPLSVHSASSRLVSGFLLGSTLTAMLLGHHYLTAPAMSIEPLKRVVALMACALFARCALTGMGMWAVQSGPTSASAAANDAQTAMILAARCGMGFVGAGVAMLMTWRTAQIRSTQSATGILYIAMIFVLFGELTSMVLSGRTGVMY